MPSVGLVVPVWASLIADARLSAVAAVDPPILTWPGEDTLVLKVYVVKKPVRPIWIVSESAGLVKILMLPVAAVPSLLNIEPTPFSAALHLPR